MSHRKPHFKSLVSVMLKIALAGGVTAAALAFAPMPRAWQASAQQLACGITQITHTTGSFGREPAVSFDGMRIAFSSNADLTGGNGDNNFEVFLYDLSTDTFTQISNTTGILVANSGAAISGDGTRVAFLSFPGGGIFLYSTQTGTLTQIPNTAGTFVNGNPSISSDGARVTFSSSADLTGGNPDRSLEIFLYDTPTGSFTQVSNSTGSPFFGHSRISADGSRIAFLSPADLTGDNPGHSIKVFFYDVATSDLTQITNSTGPITFFTPAINADGTRIVFAAQGGIFLYETGTGDLTLISSISGSFPSISSDGARIAFKSTAHQVLLHDTLTGTLTGVLPSIGFFGDILFPSISGNGTHIVFASQGDLTGGNSDQNDEIFLASCLPSRPGPPNTQVYPITAYTNLLPDDAFSGWLDPASGNVLFFDTYGKLNAFGYGLGTTVTGNVTVRDLRNGNQQVVVNLHTIEGMCWGLNGNDEPAFGFDLFEIDEGIGPASVGRGQLRITFEPQPRGAIRYPWPRQSIIANVSCDGLLRAGSGYPEGTLGRAQTTQTGLFNTGVPGGCPREHDADCFPAEHVRFIPTAGTP